jgi:hypothetical protein
MRRRQTHYNEAAVADRLAAAAAERHGGPGEWLTFQSYREPPDLVDRVVTRVFWVDGHGECVETYEWLPMR